MAETLTFQQKMAVENRGGKLLVSAAAGSGKTKVLVDRLMSYLTDPVRPADLDEFLIITYTKAAAAELRGKIAAKLTQRIAEEPGNKHLHRQLQRLYLTKISTVHGFCSDILREYAYLVELAPDFRVADENECRQLRTETVTRILDEAYGTIDADQDLQAFVDTQGIGRDDRLLPDLILKVYDSARCHLQPSQWLDDCVSNARTGALEDAGQTVWGGYLMNDLKAYLQLQIQAIEECRSRAQAAVEMEKPAQLLGSTVEQLRFLAESRTWDQILQRRAIDYGTLRFSKKIQDPQLADQIKAVRDACKKGLERKLRGFCDPSFVILEDLEKQLPALRGLVDLVQKFSEEYDRVKRSRRIVDFSDLEHRMLDLLLGRSRSGITAAARQIGDRFREVMVDEYQDSNGVQDAIFSALTEKNQNCFMVGDVKQSIYQFRLADPKIFLEKYERYSPAEQAKPREGRKILLTSNFRSGGAVLAGANDVFRTCMTPAVGGLYYGTDDALREGIPHELLGEPEVELWAVQVQEEQYQEEAAFVAQRIAQLLDGSHYVRGEHGLRPILPEDIAILLRSPGSTGGYFQSALEKLGIRCVSGGGEDLLQTEEVAVLRSVLQTISNPRQDIPLIAALSSPLFCFTADDLASFRGRNRRVCVYDALLEDTTEKAKRFLEVLRYLRQQARLQTLTQLIQTVFVQTRIDSIYGAKADGANRSSNLQAIYQLAVAFESGGPRDLEQFLAHLDAMEEKGLIAAGEQSAPGAVTLMSIHKSKGLEFPVVFVSNLSKAFNRESARGQVLCDQSLGLGLTAVDTGNRVRYPTVAKRAIAVKTMADSLSEEMRVLYVALTRAKDRLIMTYAAAGLEQDLAEIAGRMDVGNRELLTMDAANPGQWVLMTAMCRTEAGELFTLGGRPEKTALGEPPWLIRVAQPQEANRTEKMERPEAEAFPEAQISLLREGLAFRYAHSMATQTPSKQTATQRKGREKDAEAAEYAVQTIPKLQLWRRPSFVTKQDSALAQGTAVHAVLQFIRYECCGDLQEIRQELDRMVWEQCITQEQAKLISSERLYTFFQSELGQKLRNAKQVLREFKFSVLDDGSCISRELTNEKILLQGVVDCAVVEPDGIIIVDFKTDKVTEQTVPLLTQRYSPQVKTYAQAMERIFGQPVKQSYLYFFQLDRAVPVD